MLLFDGHRPVFLLVRNIGKPLVEHVLIRSHVASFGPLIEPAHGFFSSLSSDHAVNVRRGKVLLQVVSIGFEERVRGEA